MSPKYKNKMDMHIHSENSDDGVHPVMLMCEYAARNGMRVAAVTDHCECNRYRRDRFDRMIRESFAQTEKAKGIFSGRLIVLTGMELGQPLQDLNAAEDALSVGEYDFILGSLHNIKDKPDFWIVDYEKEDVTALLDRYFTELYEMVQWGKFDSLAHLTYPFRYIIGEHHINIDLSRWSKKIDEILSLLAEKEKALEINTSGYRQEYGQPLPTIDIVRRFKALGGKYITTGSDSHICKDVGSDIEKGMEIAKEAGFDSITLFQSRQPLQIPVE